LTQEELQELISEVQQHQSELDDMEVKSAHKGTPQRLYETISAFANSTDGGVILFGLDEERNYEIVGAGDPQRLQEEASQCASAEIWGAGQ
jgi:ATP-dependent DNA helicase RecG